MEMKLVEPSCSFNHKDDYPCSPSPQHETKTNSQTKIAKIFKHVKEDHKKEQLPPKHSPQRLEKIQEEIDQLLVTLQAEKQDNETSLEIHEGVIYKFLDLLEEKIENYEKYTIKWGQASDNYSSLLESVHHVSNLIRILNADSQGERIKFLFNRIVSVQHRAMLYLEEEFRLLLEEQSRSLIIEPSGSYEPKKKHVGESCNLERTNSITDFPFFTQENVSKLNKIVNEMIYGGYESECCQVYILCRRQAFEESVNKLGWEKLSIEEIQKMQWESLERQILSWINTFKVCASVNIPDERKLAESIFSDHPDMAANLFAQVTSNVGIQLFNFAECVAMTKCTSEKLFKILDMYESLRDEIPNLKTMYPKEKFDLIKVETTSAKCRLGEFLMVTFSDIGNTIKSDSAKNIVPGGGVHPLTRHVMSYIRSASNYKDTLEQVFMEHARIETWYSPELENNTTPFSVELMRVMELLDANLELKGKQYKDTALGCIFMMNNGRHIVQQVHSSNGIKQVMGETWCRERSCELRKFHKNYQVETWSKILGCLSPKMLNENGKVYKPILKERFKSFNSLFEDIHKTQSSWVVSDEQLKSELRVSVSALLVPAYRSFLGRFLQYLKPGRQTEKYIKYQPEDLEACIERLFEGNGKRNNNFTHSPISVTQNRYLTKTK